MGYGEFGGSGSVKWRVVHGNKQEKGKDHDPEPNPSTGEFTVYYDGNEVFHNQLANHKVLVVWPPDTLETALADLEDRKKKEMTEAR